MSAPMDEQYPLLFLCLHLAQCLCQWATKDAAIALLQFLPHIDDFYWWEGTGLDAGGEGEELGVGSWELGVGSWELGVSRSSQLPTNTHPCL